MNWNMDVELTNWLLGIEPGNAGDFLKHVARAAMQADFQNYPILRPTLLRLKEKYPEYEAIGKKLAARDEDLFRGTHTA